MIIDTSVVECTFGALLLVHGPPYLCHNCVKQVLANHCVIGILHRASLDCCESPMSLDANETLRLLDELSLSILRKEAPSRKHNEKRLQDAFRRRVKRHNNARTNQFEVTERLDGLEEKFQILTLDNLSDALHQRRRELKDFEYHWLPDILDLLLHLSGDPARNDNLLQVYRVPPRIGTPPPLRWKDVLADDPVDRHDRLWRVPNFRDTDDSGYDDDEDDPVTSLTSSPWRKQDKTSSPDLEASEAAILQPTQELVERSLMNSIQHRFGANLISETVFIREILFVLRGYPSLLLSKGTTGYRLASNTRVSGISLRMLRSLTVQIATTRQQVDLVQSWISERQDVVYIEAMKNAAESALNLYNVRVDNIQQNLLDSGRVTSASVIRVGHEMENICTDIFTIAELLGQVNRREPVSYLDTLFSVIRTKQAYGDVDACAVLLALLVPSLNAYLQPLWIWLQEGELEEASQFFFVQANDAAASNIRLWHDQYTLIDQGPSRPADFILTLSERILACGKTAAFIRRMSKPPGSMKGESKADFCTQQILQSTYADTILPFTEAFQRACFDDVNDLLANHTQHLKSLLSSCCGISQNLDAIEQIYLGRNMTILGNVEPKIFSRVDRCLDEWNDRFQLRDVLEAVFSGDSNPHIADAISVRSVFTSSRTMQNRRSSVKILSALSFDYRLPWPLANIIDGKSMSAYRRIALVLMQIRRARYCLERTGYLSVMTSPIDDEATQEDQTFAQILAFTLLSFLSALYDCLTVSVMQPLGQTMRHDMEEALTVDDMINVHKEYIERLECACLAASNLKVFQQSLITILDICIRFSDLVSNSARTTNGDSDAEAGSFTSAVSRHRQKCGDDLEPDSDGDEGDKQLAEGYSSFIFLDDDTSVIKELRKLGVQYQRQLRFLVAGLKGVGKAGQQVQDLVTLADRLSLNQLR